MIFAHRKYKSGTRWCVWRWTEVTARGTLYLRRLHLFETPWCSAMVHWIMRRDPVPYVHDHPVNFMSIRLRGWYSEVTPDGRVSGRVRYVPADHRHRIIDVSPGGCVTLVLAGPVWRKWGYYLPRETGSDAVPVVNVFFPWQAYDRMVKDGYTWTQSYPGGWSRDGHWFPLYG